MPSKAPHHSIRRRVEFSETDAAGLVHFSNYFRWMEAAEASYFRELGLSLFALEPGGGRGFPRVRADCRFSHPIRFEDVVEIRLRVAETTARSIAYRFTFHAVDDGKPGPRVASGGMTTIFARRHADSRLEAISLPPDWIARLMKGA